VRRSVLGALLLAAALLGAVQPVQAQRVQQRVFVTTGEPGGWLGVSLRANIGGNGSADSVLLIEGVMDGSPAQEAGVRSGDRIVRINGEPVTLGAMDMMRTEPGDRVRLTLSREGGEVWDVDLRSISRPGNLRMSTEDAAVWNIRLDSMTNQILVAADSLKTHFSFSMGRVLEGMVAPGEPHVLMEVSEVEDGAHAVVMESVRDGQSFSYRWQVPEPEDGAPFAVFVQRTEVTDRILRERSQLHEERDRVGRAESVRHRELMDDLPAGAERVDPEDPRLVGLRRTRERLETEIQVLNEKLARTSLEVLARQVPVAPSVRPEMEIRIMEEAGNVRRVFPYLMGDRWVAGAELTTLNSALSQYFPVDRGVLITEIVPGSPADESGLEPGDVIVKFGDAEIATLEDLRKELAGHGWQEAPDLTVVRKDGEVRVPLRRR